MNKQSNTYIAIYIIVLVLVMGLALAGISLFSRPLQQNNIDADKMRQILTAAHITTSGDDVIPNFKKYITGSMVVNSKGQIIEGEAFSIDIAKQIKLPAEERQLPVFICHLENETIKYILPMYGAGLWGPVWGYVALDSNGSTVYGAYFAHQGETPGLGAEIEKPEFCNAFNSKNFFKDSTFKPIEVIKAGQKTQQDNADYVNGISGGTITSKGVNDMIANSLTPYKAFLESLSTK